MMRLTNTCSYAVTIFCLLLSHGAIVRADQANDREQIAQRLRRLANLTIEFDRVTRHDPDPNLPLPAEAKGHVRPPFARTETFGERVSVRGESLLFWSEASKADCAAALAAGNPITRVSALAITPGRAESLTWGVNVKRAAGRITDRRPIPYGLAIDMALGLRLENSEKWLTADDLRAATITPSGDDDHVVLQFKTGDGNVHSFTQSRRNGYAVERYHVDYPRPAEVEDFVCSDFRRVDGVVLPFRIERQSTYNDTSGEPRHPIVTTITARRYSLDNPAAAAAKPLALPWSKGTSVLDERNHVILEIQNDGEVLTDEGIAAVIKQQEAKQKDPEGRAGQKINAIPGGSSEVEKSHD
jgi:hypothetical protein